MQNLLVTIDQTNLGEPRHDVPAADRLISGTPTFKTWALDEGRDGQVRTGIWEATPGVTKSIKGEVLEFCHILEGLVEVTPEGGPTVTYKAGDSFLMKPGFVGEWKTIETVRKIYVFVG